MKKWAWGVDGISEPFKLWDCLCQFLFNAITYCACGEGDLQVMCRCRERQLVFSTDF